MNNKKTAPCGIAVWVWIISTVAFSVLLNAINKTGQSMGSIIFVSCLLGGGCAVLTVIINAFKNIKKNREIAYSQTQEYTRQTNLGVQQEYDRVVQQTMQNGMVSENISFNSEEEIFFKTLISSMKESKLWNTEGLRLRRLSDGTFNVDCRSCHVGKVRLRGNTYMQVFRGLYQMKEYRDVELEECLEQIPAWIRYIKYCQRI